MSDSASHAEYRVLARKYRPVTFSDMIGQEVMVRILTHAFERNRVAHAFLLTGIRGIGKTTTARILARALNCIGEDGKNTQPTITPCGVCDHCKMIREDRHVDVLEMDAASRTGVGDIREIIESVKYRPASARYKIYIIDEVHMLSTSAFNALLKTLEEPPPHVKFIFATTELRKIPVTILSRCQRFDLRRIDTAMLTAHLQGICQKEAIDAEEAALHLVAAAAEGSVRDALSLLDQAIAHAEGNVDAATVSAMLGLADRTACYDMLEPLFAGKVPETMAAFQALYQAGGDPLLSLQDLLQACHFISRLKLVPELAKDQAYSDAERQRALALADVLSLPALARVWQMLLKGLDEVQHAPNPAAAVEMILIRTAYTSTLPTPEEALKQAESAGPAASLPEQRSAAPRGTAPAASRSSQYAPGAASAAMPASAPAAQPQLEEPVAELASMPQDFEALVTLFHQQQEPRIAHWLEQDVQLVQFALGAIEFHSPNPVSPPLLQKASSLLQQWTGKRWMFTLSSLPGQPTLAAQAAVRQEARKQSVLQEPAIARIIALFPGATVTGVRPRRNTEQPQ